MLPGTETLNDAEPLPTIPERVPRPARAPRMEPLATLPVFFKLEGKRVVVAGGSEAAVWKAELLSAAGALVVVYAANCCPELEALAADPPRGPISLQRSLWSPASFAGATLVVGATDDDGEGARIFDAARAAGIPINVIDKPQFCTFQFGAIVNRSPLVVSISTDGGAPILAQAIRSRIETMLPPGFARWAQAAKDWRKRILRFRRVARRRFWERFTDLALAAPDCPPSAECCDKLLEEMRTDRCGHGHVSLVGAGPGNPELLTLKAVRVLRSADVILFDDLVAPQVLEFARREAKRLLVGKSGRGPSCRQAEINALMVQLAKAGERVVRLKAGDPLIFGRASEEIAALRRAGIPFDVVPGISAAQGAAASLEISLTERAGARRLQLVTGHARGGHLPDDVDWNALADRSSTTAVYMPIGTLRALTRRLLAVGVEPGRCASAVFNATREDEVVVVGTVATISDLASEQQVAGPCLVLIGNVLRSLVRAEQTTPSTRVIPSPVELACGAGLPRNA
jgi:uroporphyrin-III C-methyltransferase/precorrin-2 dehydrogenase/sirohydrochlorin ferrochelatase